jgi:hypothetical protein
MDRITEDSSAAIATRIGRLVESNLTNFAFATMRELARADKRGDDTSPLLTMGLGMLRARQSVRSAIRDAERQRWEARKR